MAFSFPSASDSRSAADLKAIFDENCAIGAAVLQARCDGLRVAVICDSPMTNSVEHYNACFVDPIDPCDFDQQHLLDLQNEVETCWRQLGYSIKKITDPDTGNTFCWEIRW